MVCNGWLLAVTLASFSASAWCFPLDSGLVVQPGTSVGNASISLAGKVCATNTGHRCRFFNCPSSLGSTLCSASRYCVCPDGFCLAIAGYCASASLMRCQKDTGSRCSLFGCNAWRGNTTCTDGTCHCGEGTCLSEAGECVAEKDGVTCQRDTGDKCTATGMCFPFHNVQCSRSLSDAERGACVCDPGTCYFKRFGGLCLRPEVVRRIMPFTWLWSHPLFVLVPLAFACFFYCVCVPAVASTYCTCVAVSWLVRKYQRRDKAPLKAPLLNG